MADRTLNAKTHAKSALISELLPLVGLFVVILLFGLLTKGKVFSKSSLQTIYQQSLDRKSVV